VKGEIREGLGRDKNYLSRPETLVFIRVLKDFMRDEGFFISFYVSGG
jgi:hypothetical protein